MRTFLPALALLFLGACASEPSTAPLRVPLGDSPQRGPADAWVTLVEFADFQCPACGRAEATVKELLARYPDDVRLVHKHFPLPQHANARPAANAAECARVQGPAPDGHFWEMHDLLFMNQAVLANAALATYASRIPGLDLEAWQTCFDARAEDARVAADLALGTDLGVAATPTFVVNGRTIVGAVSLSTLEAAVEEARAEAIASGIPRAEYYERAVLGR